MAEGIDSPDAEGVGVAADRPEVAGVAEGVGIVMGKELCQLPGRRGWEPQWIHRPDSTRR